MKCIDELPASEWKGKKVLVRAGLDLPLGKDGEVSDMFRVKKAFQTIRFLSDAGARVVILSHIGRDPSESNEPVFRALKQLTPLSFVPDLYGAAAQQAVQTMADGDILLLDNLRKDPGETKNDETLAKNLAALGDIYVDDAFSNAHREHASMVGIPKFLPHYAGILMRDEVVALTAARMPEHPSLAIIGGAKFETKAPLAKALLASHDHLFMTGALANDVFKARGLNVGVSLVSSELPQADVLEHQHFVAPVDVTVERPDKQAMVRKPNEVASDEKIVDIGPDTLAMLAPMIEQAQSILWNGPTGIFEAGYTHWTHAIAELIEKRVAAGAKVVIGGGDTIAAIEESGIDSTKMGFLSTGGGAMLDFVLQGTLPAIQALE